MCTSWFDSLLPWITKLRPPRNFHTLVGFQCVPQSLRAEEQPLNARADGIQRCPVCAWLMHSAFVAVLGGGDLGRCAGLDEVIRIGLT